MIKLLKIFKNRFEYTNKGFSLLELLITLAIFGILMVTTTSILVINLTVARKVKARSYAREETAFMFNVLKKDIRNAEPGLLVEESNGDSLTVTVLDENSQSHTYTWSMDGNRVQRVENSVQIASYKTPSDIEFQDLLFEGVCDENNCIVKISTSAWAAGMPGDEGDSCESEDKQCITKEVAVSTRNFDFEE